MFYCLGRGNNSEDGIGVLKPVVESLLLTELVPNVTYVRDAIRNTGAIMVCIFAIIFGSTVHS